MAGRSRLERHLKLLPHWSTHSEYEMLRSAHKYIDKMRSKTIDDRIKRMYCLMVFQTRYWEGYRQVKQRGR